MLQSQLLFSLDLAAGSCLGVKYACILAPHIALETTREVQTIPKKNVKDKVKIAAREETSPYCHRAQFEQRVGGSGSAIDDREYAQTIIPPAEPKTVNSNDAVN